MDLAFIYKRFPDRAACIKHLEQVRWNGTPVCPSPQCGSVNSSAMPFELRHHCNNCNYSYSVTVDTLFHKTKIDFQKWFYLIWKVLNHHEQVNYMQLAKEIGVHKKTSRFMVKRIEQGTRAEDKFLLKVVNSSDFYEYGGI